MPFFPTDITNKSVKPFDDLEQMDDVNYAPLALDVGRYLVTNSASTFFAKVEGEQGDILIIDKSVDPIEGATVVVYTDGEFRLKYFDANVDSEIWGVVRYYIKKM
ncbi:MAG: hypothetical protein SNH13_02815 [Rikenellaceae bacterium]